MSETESIIPHPKLGRIRAKDMKFETIKEDWNVYKLEDGTTIRVKLVVLKISRAIDPETGGILYIEETGEPLYNVRHNIIVVADVPKELLKKE